MLSPVHIGWPSARHFAEAIQCPKICFSNRYLQQTLPAFDRLGMPLVTSGQFAYVFKLNSPNTNESFAVRCFRGYLGDREERYKAISTHLSLNPIPPLARYEYEPEGILVNGERYPILIMEWIKGATLDVYIEEVLGRRDVLLHIADQWADLISLLHETKIAHGDLQHGNIIVENGMLRLVDLDGMFVPTMQGLKATEVGHLHYQHPARDENYFDSTLDNFSALVIYLSLISLAEEPSLWEEYHDENLLFTKDDFLDPSSSSLFKRVKDIGPEHERFASILENAAKDSPASTPSLAELISSKTKLPSWMVAPDDMQIVERTREAQVIEVKHVDVKFPEYNPQNVSGSSPMFANPQQVQSALNSLPASSYTYPLSHSQIWSVGMGYTRAYLKNILPLIYLWMIAGKNLMTMLGFSSLAAWILAILAFPLIASTVGFLRAINEYQLASNLVPFVPKQASTSFTGWGLNLSSKSTSALPSSNVVVIGSRTQTIYHLSGCSWATKISKSNRVEFPNAVAAEAAGYRPCRVCFP
jgi:serine/threonine protein kinase